MKAEKMQFGVYLMKIKIFKVVQFSTPYIYCPFHFFIKSDAATPIIFSALIFNPDTWELAPAQCEGLSQAFPVSEPSLCPSPSLALQFSGAFS